MSHGHAFRNNTVRPRDSLFYLLPTIPPPHSRQASLYMAVNSGETKLTRNHLCFFRTCQQASFLPQGLAHASPSVWTCSPQGTCSSCFLSPLAPATKVWLVKSLFDHKGHILPDCRTPPASLWWLYFLFGSHRCQIMIYVFFLSSVSPAGLFYSLLFPHFPMPRTTTGI